MKTKRFLVDLIVNSFGTGRMTGMQERGRENEIRYDASEREQRWFKARERRDSWLICKY